MTLTPGPSPTDSPRPTTSPWERGELIGRRRRLSRGSGAMVDAARTLRKEATQSENLLWDAIRRRQLGHKFRRQHPVGQFVLDFYCAEQRLAIEVDGSIHEDSREVDAERDALLRVHGIRVIRLSAELVETDLESAIKSIKQGFTRHPSPAVVRGRAGFGGRGAGGEGI